MLDGDETRGLTPPRLRPAAPPEVKPTFDGPDAAPSRGPAAPDAPIVEVTAADGADVDAASANDRPAKVAPGAGAEAATAEPPTAEAARSQPATAEAATAKATTSQPAAAETANAEMAAAEPATAETAATETIPATAAGEDPPAEPLRAPAPDEDLNRVGRRRRARYAHALRRSLLPPAVTRRLRAWTSRRSARVALPGLMLMMAIVATGGAGALLVPAMAERAEPTEAPSTSTSAPSIPELSTMPTTPPTIGGTLGPTGAPIVQRPADALDGWAAQLSPRVGVPPTALEAYGYAELVVAQTTPSCGLKWTTLAAIGKVESSHGRANGATLLADGRSLPTIFGPPLNGTNNTMKIPDTDNGVLDGDQTWDRAVGPMQFIPTTWEGHSVDADNDGMRDPGDIDDAALAAANYLCQGGRDLTNIGDWWAAILTYNEVQPYARSVFDTANDYGIKSRT